jgi:hypothetical protein
LKAVHRDDPKAVGIPPRLGCVFPRDEEHIHVRTARADRFLLHAADRSNRSVEADLPGGRDALPMVDVVSELLE